MIPSEVGRELEIYTKLENGGLVRKAEAVVALNVNECTIQRDIYDIRSLLPQK